MRSLGIDDSALGNIAPGCALERVGLAWQTEYSFANDVALDLGRTALDRVGSGAQELFDPISGVIVVGLPSHGICATKTERWIDQYDRAVVEDDNALCAALRARVLRGGTGPPRTLAS
jgi:hypothetical protein